jgi:hypothetical protein
LEFYRKPELNLQRRLWWHAAKLLQMFHNPVKILVFASFADQAEKDASFWIMPYKMDTKTGHPISAIEKINIQSLDLRTISQQLLSNENIIIQGKQLRKAGREWLKLLSVGQWQDREGQFNLLMSDDMTPEVVSAIKTLSKK